MNLSSRVHLLKLFLQTMSQRIKKFLCLIESLESRKLCLKNCFPFSQCNIHCFAIIYSVLQCTTLYTAMHYTVYCNALHCTAIFYTVVQCNTLHCTALHCTALHCTALHCTGTVQQKRWRTESKLIKLVSLSWSSLYHVG